MAMSDYYSCDVCGAKAFYDAELNYSESENNKTTGMPQLDYVGDMKVICTKCSETHEILVVERY